MTIKIFHDACHGGKGTGALGFGLIEKAITLKLSRYFGEIIRENCKDIEERASRIDDRYLSLTKRSKMANDWGADFLISFHINGFRQSSWI